MQVHGHGSTSTALVPLAKRSQCCGATSVWFRRHQCLLKESEQQTLSDTFVLGAAESSGTSEDRWIPEPIIPNQEQLSVPPSWRSSILNPTARL